MTRKNGCQEGKRSGCLNETGLPSCPLDLGKRTAFTLAEVLITLGIIGVVAAITMPLLIQNIKDKVLANQAKKSVSMINNALTMTKVHNGYDSFEDLFSSDKTSDEILEIFAKELNVLKICKLYKGGCWTWRTKYSKKQYSAGVTTDLSNNSLSSAVLADGTVIAVNVFKNERQGGCNWVNVYYKTDSHGNRVQDENGDDIQVRDNDNRCGQISVDVNGSKGPNQLGADTFNIGVLPDKIRLDSLYNIYNDKLEYENYNVGESN